MSTEYRVKIQEAKDESARYVTVIAGTDLEAATKAVEWSQRERAYGWDGEVKAGNSTFPIIRHAAGDSRVTAL